jgi:hypothetical protein
MKLWRILSVCMVLLCAASSFASQVNRSSGIGLPRTGPTTARGGISEAGGDFGRLLDRPANLNNGQSDFERLLDLPFKLPDVPTDKASVKGILTPKNIAKALRGGVGGYVAGEAFKRLAEEACVRLMGGSMQLTESGAWEECVPGTPTPQSDGYRYRMYLWFTQTGEWRTVIADACEDQRKRIAVVYPERNWVVTQCTKGTNSVAVVKITGTRKLAPFDVFVQDAGGGLQTEANLTCPAGWYITSSGCVQTAPPQGEKTYTPVSTERAQQKLEDAVKLPANSGKVWDAIRDYADKGGGFDIDQPLAVTGPAQSPTSTTTTTSTQQTSTGPQTVTTTNSTVINYNYAGDTVTVNQVTNSVTRNSAGDVISSTTTNSPPEAPEEPPVDSPLPPVPDLYVRKYPNGMEGIYDQYKDQLKNTSLVQLATQLMPNVGSSGQCPSWPMNFNLATWAAYGVHDVAPPCWIWSVAKAILILSALLLARALIFGG